MKYSELREYRTLKSDELFYSIEVNRLKLLLDEKVTYYSTPSMNGTPTGNTQSPTERIAIAKLEYGAEIEKQIAENTNKLQMCRERIANIDRFIDEITEAETKSLMLRHIKHGVSFRQLARERFVSRAYVSKKIFSVCEK